ncbi:MAG: hypothetical protein JWO08_1711 [Verrucomicrobiaceae bacterium]|nr:hypothetical protein [Verrucomicrobiaceae bacterium]
MKFLLFLTLPLTFTLAVQAEDLANHSVFKHYLGKWTAEGELKGTDNNVVTVTEDWEGKSDGDNSFVLAGSRTLNKDTTTFKWTFALNPAAGTCEANLTAGDGSQPLRFEVNISDVNLTLEMKALTGQTSAITVKDEFTDEKHESLVSHVIFTNDEGKTTLEGDIKHKKTPKL